MLLLAFTSHRGVFVAAVALFLIAAVLYHRLTLPAATRARQQALSQLATDARRLFGSPAMRGAMLLSAAAITIGAMVMVNTVVLARGVFDRDEQSAVIALGVFGAGGVIAALFLPRLTAGGAERSVMLMAGVSMTGLLISGAMLPGFYSMLGLWAALGAASTLAQLPVSTMISRTSTPGDRQGLYAVHFGVNHALLFVAYLAAGWIGAEAGFVAAFLGLGVFSLLLVALATWVWPRGATPPARATRQQ
jgi:predicted MFS family arabinose efflux permease